MLISTVALRSMVADMFVVIPFLLLIIPQLCVAVTCSSFSCPPLSHMKYNPASITCVLSTCTRDDCCDDNRSCSVSTSQCSSYDFNFVIPGIKGTIMEHNSAQETCCAKIPKCGATFVCPHGRRPTENMSSTQCRSFPCEDSSSCCAVNPRCGISFVCGDGYAPKDDMASLFCNDQICRKRDCCDVAPPLPTPTPTPEPPPGTCESFVCQTALNGVVIVEDRPGKNTTTCAGPACTVFECCTPVSRCQYCHRCDDKSCGWNDWNSCPNGYHYRRPGQASLSPGSYCLVFSNLNSCCEENQTCGKTGQWSNVRWTCPTGYHQVDPAVHCSQAYCNDDDCCLPNDRCSSFVCPAGFHDTVGMDVKICPRAECRIDDCCSPNPHCDPMRFCYHAWPTVKPATAQKYLVPFSRHEHRHLIFRDKPDIESIICSSGRCSLSDCCDAVVPVAESCDNFDCPLGFHATRANTPCAVPGYCWRDDCCQSNALCPSSFACPPLTHQKLPPTVSAPKTCGDQVECVDPRFAPTRAYDQNNHNPDAFQGAAYYRLADVECSACDFAQCCQEWKQGEPQCRRLRCPVNFHKKPNADDVECINQQLYSSAFPCDVFECCDEDEEPARCAGPTCVADDCCADNESCHASKVTCPAGTHLTGDVMQPCLGPACTVGECCAQNASCSAFTCSDRYFRRTDSACADPFQCTHDECCVAGPCLGYNCPSGSALKSAPMPMCTGGSVCNPDECCDGLLTQCDDFGCPPQTHRKTETTGFCARVKCGIYDCCVENEQCDTFVCPPGKYVRTLPPNVRCMDAKCVELDCCEANPHTCDVDCDFPLRDVSGKATVFCANAICDLHECCETDPSSLVRCPATFDCGEQLITKPFASDQVCAEQVCTRDECCKIRSMVSRPFDTWMDSSGTMVTREQSVILQLCTGGIFAVDCHGHLMPASTCAAHSCAVAGSRKPVAAAIACPSRPNFCDMARFSTTPCTDCLCCEYLLCFGEVKCLIQGGTCNDNDVPCLCIDKFEGPNCNVPTQKYLTFVLTLVTCFVIGAWPLSRLVMQRRWPSTTLPAVFAELIILLPIILSLFDVAADIAFIVFLFGAASYEASFVKYSVMAVLVLLCSMLGNATLLLRELRSVSSEFWTWYGTNTKHKYVAIVVVGLAALNVEIILVLSSGLLGLAEFNAPIDHSLASRLQMLGHYSALCTDLAQLAIQVAVTVKLESLNSTTVVAMTFTIVHLFLSSVKKSLQKLHDNATRQATLAMRMQKQQYHIDPAIVEADYDLDRDDAKTAEDAPYMSGDDGGHSSASQ